MSIYDDAALVMIPSGYKASKLYSVVPDDGDGDFTVTRAGDTATRINSDLEIEGVDANIPRLNYFTASGCPQLLAEPERTNLLGYSESFGNSDWTKGGATIEGDASTAGSELVTDGDMLTPASWTMSSNWTISGGGQASYDDLASGAFLQAISMTVGTMYKITYTVSNFGGSYINIVFRNDIFGNLLDGIGNQIHTVAGTYTVYGILGTATSAILIYGNVESDGTFDLTDISVKEVQGFSCPMVDSSGDNTLQAFKLVESAATEIHKMLNTILSINETTHSSSIFVKNDGVSKIGFRDAYNEYITFDIISKTIIAHSTTTTLTYQELSDGWLRLNVIYPVNGTVYNSSLVLLDDNYTTGNPITYSYQGDGTSGIYIFGAQLEEGSYSTSYIRSEAGGTVTRSADAVTGAGDATTFASVNSSGVLYAEIGALADDLTNRYISISNGASIDRVAIFYEPETNSIRCFVTTTSGSNIYDNEYTVASILDYHKVAIRYKTNNFSLWIDGSQIGSTQTTGTVNFNTPLSSLQYNSGGGSASTSFYGNTKQVAVYNYLTDEQMISLTTP